MNFDHFHTETTRLIIRAFTEQDAPRFFLVKTHPKVNIYTNDELWHSVDDAYEFIQFAKWLYTDDPERHWFRLFFAICEKETNDIIGCCGIGNPRFHPEFVEVFYTIQFERWGNGFATEAAQAMIRLGFNKLNLQRIVGFAEQENRASIRVLKKIGMNCIGEISGASEEFSYYNGQALYEIRKATSRYA